MFDKPILLKFIMSNLHEFWWFLRVSVDKRLPTEYITFAQILSFLVFSFTFSKQYVIESVAELLLYGQKHKIVVIFYQIWWE